MTTSQCPPTIAWMPQNAALSALVTSLLNTALAVGFVVLSTAVVGVYGYMLFAGLPVVLGILSVRLHGLHGPRPVWHALLIITFTLLLTCIAMCALPLEGIGCMAMAFPLWVVFGLTGVLVAYPFHAARWRAFAGARGFPVMLLLLVVALPTLLGMERAANVRAPEQSVVSSVNIDAPPEIVWKYVIAFPPLQKPHDWIFTLGAAYPQEAVIVGHGPGAIRRCVFSTGAFVEPVTLWQDNQLLAFDVSQCPPSMQEWSLYSNLHPRHLEGYFVSRHGQFKLTPLPGGRTRLEGTTWYTNQMFPTTYWNLWSSTIIHRIHLQVLDHIKSLAEREGSREKAPGLPRAG
jgi:hypothetical protein